MPAACTRARRSAPIRFDGVSPMMPRARLAITMRCLAMACSKCSVLFDWPMTFKITGEKRKASILFKTGSIACSRYSSRQVLKRCSKKARVSGLVTRESTRLRKSVSVRRRGRSASEVLAVFIHLVPV